MPTNGQAVKIAHYTRSKFNSLSNKDSATIYYVEEPDGKIKQYVGNTHVVSDFTETDPTVPSHVKGITSGNISSWNNKFNTPSGTTSQYVRGNGSLATFPSIPTLPSIMGTTEGNTGTATTRRTINAANLKSIILNHSPAGSRPASDVSAWAKKATLEIGDIPTGTSGTTVALGNHTHSLATQSAAGFLSAADKIRLDGIATGAQVNVGTNLSQGDRNTTTLRIDSSTGSNLTLPASTTSLAGLMSATDKTRLNVLHSLLEEDTSNNVVDSINEVLAVFNNYPEGADLVTALAGKVDKVNGKGLSTNDFTTTEKNKLSGIQSGAQKNVQSNWNATSGDTLILNKPYIPTKTSDLTNDSNYTTYSTLLSEIDLLVKYVDNNLNTKQSTITGAATTITSNNLTANRALISNGSGKVAVSAVTSTELGYLDGVTSGIQGQLNSKMSASDLATALKNLPNI